ncbi:VOC family protein [Neobacillus niacini]|uniref:VOC family protein n=1 Tax=Neobacillus niacini TaxID=86668 RepID=UPI002FFDFAD5
MHLHHFAIEVEDLDTSIAFYQEFIGLSEEVRISFQDEEIVFLANADFKLELISGGQQQDSKGIHICFEVDRIQEVINHFKNKRILALEGPYKLKNGWETVFYNGPDNEVIEFLQIEKKADK